MRAIDVTSEQLARYVDKRQQEGGSQCDDQPRIGSAQAHVLAWAAIDSAQSRSLAEIPQAGREQRSQRISGGWAVQNVGRVLPELWFRSLVECGRTYGWRVSELLSMRVNQLDIAQRVIRLEPGTTKNRDGREVPMTERSMPCSRAWKAIRRSRLHSSQWKACPRLSDDVAECLYSAGTP